MAYKLRNGLHFCVSEGRLILFDVPGDRYFALQPAADAAFQDIARGHEPGPAVRELERAKILIWSDSDSEPLRPASVTKAIREIDCESASPFVRFSTRCVIAQLRAIAWLRLRNFEAVIGSLGTRYRNGTDGREQEMIALSRAFAATAPLRLRHRHCLSSSLAYFHVIRTLGMNAKLVMGVCAQPFSAHCWVQSGETVLNDRLENIAPFQPIFYV
ncbi:Transglutaminase-like superfamily protein [Sphingobium sp. AP50]|uniref:lasso peptide biosynthesis B2 protein n=1 Tax=Sphingobium sp. AP50 TaxID=1884369 RepID=UPI0008D7B510|nr:lasso peptide biosynthesis B2 protein [Sphingobium sp. AP50]SEJ72960.1 Transglutaminase-like superfamily protein [Sphingobium sp. AP50]